MERQVETGMMNREETEREGRPEEDSRLWQMAGIDTAAGLEYAGEDGYFSMIFDFFPYSISYSGHF